jgi:hypothetical protein
VPTLELLLKEARKGGANESKANLYLKIEENKGRNMLQKTNPNPIINKNFSPYPQLNSHKDIRSKTLILLYKP